MHDLPKIISIDNYFFQKLLTFKNIEFENVSGLFKFKNSIDYNFLVDINSVFSNSPRFHPVDRTGTVKMPIQWTPTRPWSVPKTQLTLDEAMCQRVKNLGSLDKKINIFWSGGIDSTAIVTAFLKYHDHHDQIRIVYSPWSRFEHNEYLDFLKKFPAVELVNASDQLYMDLHLDGIIVSGNSGDEAHASIDQSFLDLHGVDSLQQPWVDFFYKNNSNDEFIGFCKRFFSLSGFEITTVLEARWWFYASCKVNSILHNQTIPFSLSNKSCRSNINNVKDVYGFFDCDEYESYIYWNISSIMPTHDYASWKQNLKDFCYRFDNLETWYKNKTKYSSRQMTDYQSKKIVMNDSRFIMILDNCEKIQTPSLPFFSKLEFEQAYGNSLDYLFNV
jgi:hypothetical protein